MSIVWVKDDCFVNVLGLSATHGDLVNLFGTIFVSCRPVFKEVVKGVNHVCLLEEVNNLFIIIGRVGIPAEYIFSNFLFQFCEELL